MSAKFEYEKHLALCLLTELYYNPYKPIETLQAFENKYNLSPNASLKIASLATEIATSLDEKTKSNRVSTTRTQMKK